MPLRHPQVMTPPPALFLGGLLVGYSLDQALPIPTLALPGQDIASITLLVLGTLLVAGAVWQLRHADTTVLPHRAASQLVTGGLFAFSRNPIYLGFVCLHLAMALSLASLGMAVMLLPVIWVIDRHVIAAEEAFHAQQFGEQWQQYRGKVRRWL